MNTLARLVSYLFHPLLMATYLFSLLAWVLPSGLEPISPNNQTAFILILFVVTFLLPVLNLGIFKVFGAIKTFHMIERRERMMPFFFVSLIYIVITYMMWNQMRLSFNDNFLRFMIIIDLLIVLATLITLFYKISVHSLAVWGVIGILIPLNKIAEINTLFYPTLAVIILAGVIMSARLQLRAHSLREVMWGGILGFTAGISGMFVFFGR